MNSFLENFGIFAIFFLVVYAYKKILEYNEFNWTPMHTIIELFKFTGFHFLDYYMPSAVTRLEYFSRILKTPYTLDLPFHF